MPSQKAYIPGFKYDIFISYAHVDNITTPDEDMGWVETFCKYLEVELGKKIGRSDLVKIWWDKRDLDPAQKFDNEIVDGLQESAVLIALYSNGYEASDYCQEQELRPFYEKAKVDEFGLEIGDNRFRIYPLFLADFHHSAWPTEFQGVSGFPFHAVESKSDVCRPGSEEFRDCIRSLVNSLSETLKIFKQTAEAKAGNLDPKSLEDKKGQGKVKEEARTVFIADVPDTLQSTAQKLIYELGENGIQVVQKVPPPYEAVAHDEKIKEIAASCLLSIHLLDQFPGRAVEERAPAGFRERQVNIMRSTGVNQFIWVPQGIDIQNIEDETYQTFIDELQAGKREEGHNFEFVRSQPTALIPEVMERLKQEKSNANEALHDSGKVGVLIDTHQKDQLEALDFINFLADNKVPTFVSSNEDDPRANLKELEVRLRQVRTLLILYGRVKPDWVRQRVGEILKLNIVKDLGIKECCVLNVPPEKELDLDFGMARVNLINFVGSKEEGEEQLLAVLNQASGGVK